MDQRDRSSKETDAVKERIEGARELLRNREAQNTSTRDTEKPAWQNWENGPWVEFHRR